MGQESRQDSWQEDGELRFAAVRQSSNPTSSSLTIFAGIGLSVVDDTADDMRQPGARVFLSEMASALLLEVLHVVGEIGPPWRTISISSSRCGILIDERIEPLHVRMRVERVGSGRYGAATELISDRGRGGGKIVVGGLAPPTRSERAILAIGDLPDPDMKSRDEKPAPLDTRRTLELPSSPTAFNRAHSASFSARRRAISHCCWRISSSFASSSRLSAPASALMSLAPGGCL